MVIKKHLMIVGCKIRSFLCLQLFDHIANCIDSFIEDKKLDRTVELPLGFTFSFPCKQEGLAKARLVTWTKGFNCSGVVNEDIVRLLHESVAKKVRGYAMLATICSLYLFLDSVIF